MNKINSKYKVKKIHEFFVQYFLDKNVQKNPPTLTESHTHTDLPLSTAAILLHSRMTIFWGNFEASYAFICMTYNY